jgi:hypothetical protein
LAAATLAPPPPPDEVVPDDPELPDELHAAMSRTAPMAASTPALLAFLVVFLVVRMKHLII